MKLSYLLILLSLTNILSAQDIALDYTKDDGNTIKNIPITKDTRTLTIQGVKSFKKFYITVNNLPTNHKILIHDDINAEIGLLTANGSKLLTSEELNNRVFMIILEDDKGGKTVFATVLIQILPKTKLNMIAKIPALTAFGKAL